MNTHSPLATTSDHARRVRDELIATAEQLTSQNVRRYVRGLPLKARLALRTALMLPKGSLTIKLPDGRVVRAGGHAPGPDGVIILHNWNLPKRAFAQGTVGVGESYMDGDWESPDVPTFLELFLVNESVGNRLATANAWISALARVRHWFNRNTKVGARKNIAAHYDLGNAFYSLWLDPSMTYSSAVFQSPDMSLKEAQQEKYRRLAQATGIGPDDHVLEIGCGWGGFAEFAAREIGCRVTGLTISREQLDFARERIRQAGLHDKVTLKFQDYRDETGTYDKVISIEMFEAVGEKYWPQYFSKVHDFLKPGGKAGLQIISIKNEAYPLYRRSPDFIQRYIFPGGMLPTPAILDRLTAENELKIDNIDRFPQDYARTLALWHQRFVDAWPQIAPLGFDDRFRLMWEFYFFYCQAGFRSEFIDVRQVICSRA